METYKTIKQRHTEEVHSFTEGKVYWAFGKEQYQRLLNTLHLSEEELKEQFAPFIGGGIIRKSAIQEYKAIVKRHGEELRAFFTDHINLADAMVDEFFNHECMYSCREAEIARMLRPYAASEEDYKKAYREAVKRFKKEYSELDL